MQKAYQTQLESHQAQIEGLKEIHKQEIREKQKLMESHLESIAAIGSLTSDIKPTLGSLSEE